MFSTSSYYNNYTKNLVTSTLLTLIYGIIMGKMVTATGEKIRMPVPYGWKMIRIIRGLTLILILTLFLCTSNYLRLDGDTQNETINRESQSFQLSSVSSNVADVTVSATPLYIPTEQE